MGCYENREWKKASVFEIEGVEVLKALKFWKRGWVLNSLMSDEDNCKYWHVQ